jgi:formiminotetrahydrofolate cyclodeaminase
VNDEVPDYLGLPLGRFLELVASEDPAPAGRAGGEFHDALSRAADVPLTVARFGAEVAEISARLARAAQEGRIDAPRNL